MKNSPVWITEGDPAGISYELISASERDVLKTAEKRPVILVQSQKEFSPEKYINFNEEIFKNALSGFYLHSSPLVSENPPKLTLGTPSEFSGACAYSSLSEAVRLQKKFGGDIITLPLSKEWVQRSEKFYQSLNIKAADRKKLLLSIKSFSGHTEELQRQYKKNTFMLMYSSEISVIPLTTHVPLMQVRNHLKKVEWEKLFSALENTDLFTEKRIGICGINPHAGEGGKMGTEEIEILIPVIEKYRKKGWNIEGPVPADSIFTKEQIIKYDIILSCYHDQGLIPFKHIAGKNGVNTTLGLDFIRVSPDHGTAFDIAGKGTADPTSFKACLKLIENRNS